MGEPSAVALLRSREAVAQTPGEATGSLLSVGSEIGHLVRRELPARRKLVPHGGAGMHLRERAARFLGRLYATASRERGSETNGPFPGSTVVVVSATGNPDRVAT
jgi:hypothetical protein